METVINGNNQKYYSNQLSSTRIHLNNLYNNSYDFKCGLRKLSIVLVCEIGDHAAHLYKHSGGGHKLLENAAT